MSSFLRPGAVRRMADGRGVFHTGNCDETQARARADLIFPSAGRRLILVLPVTLLPATVLAAAIIAAAIVCAAIICPVAVALAVMLAVFRHVLVVVPAVLHKVNGLAARIVFAAMFAPVLLMAWFHMEIDRPRSHGGGRSLHDDRLRGNQFRRTRQTADFDAAEETGLSKPQRVRQVSRIGCQ